MKAPMWASRFLCHTHEPAAFPASFLSLMQFEVEHVRIHAPYEDTETLGERFNLSKSLTPPLACSCCRAGASMARIVGARKSRVHLHERTIAGIW